MMMTDDLKKQLQRYFPEEIFSDEVLDESLQKDEILLEKNKILHFLQSALLDDKVLEIELNGKPRVYFTRLKDDIPDKVEEVQEDGNIVLIEPQDYNEGDYLLDKTHLITLPLEPGVGNLHLRYSQTIVLRMFTNTFGVEMGTSFDSLVKIRDLPVLRLEYPEIARIVHNAREFRAKVPEELDFNVTIEIDEDDNFIDSAAVDISLKGAALSLTKKEQRLLMRDEIYPLKLYIDDQLLAILSGRIAHLSKVRKKRGIEYICGIQFDIETRTVAASIESIVASVQRAHLKALEKKSEITGIDLIA